MSMTTEQMNEKLAEIALKAQTLDEQMKNLAEECAELAQAALKFTRAVNHKYIDSVRAMDNLVEEIGDVENTIAATKAMILEIDPTFQVKIDASRDFKVRRWASRVEAERGIEIDFD